MSDTALQDFIRKPFRVQAVQVTPLNIRELAELCGGQFRDDGEKEGHLSREYIKVRVLLPVNEKHTKAHLSDWLVKQGNSWKVYSDHSFRKAFELDGNPIKQPNQRQNNGKSKRKGKGRPQQGVAQQQRPGQFVPPSPAQMPKKRTDIPQRGDTISHDASLTADQAMEMALAASQDHPDESVNPEAAAAKRSEPVYFEHLDGQELNAQGKISEEQAVVQGAVAPEPEPKPITLDDLDERSPGEVFRGEG